MHIVIDSNRRNSQGSALLMSMIISGVMLLSLASYFKGLQQERASMGRSLTWNSAMPVAEAGVEEALAHINSHDMNLVADNGWALSGGYLTKSKSMGSNSWTTCISTSLPPVIVSQAFMQLPGSTNQVSRTIRVTTKSKPYFPRCITAKLTIDLKGYGVSVDSYNSTDPTASTNGLYDPTKRRDHGSVATDSSLIDSVNTGNASIWGTVATGPGGTVTAGSNGSVGDAAWHNAGNKGIEPGVVTDDVNISLPDAQVPAQCLSAFAPMSGIVNGTNYDMVLGDGYYLISNSKGLGGQIIVSGKAVVLVTSQVQLSGQDFIYIQPGASLQLYVSAPQTSFGGQGIYNASGVPGNFTYYGLPTNTSISYSGGSGVAAAVYAPSAVFTMGGGGSTDLNFMGALVCLSLKMNGTFDFHYDENLPFGIVGGWVASGWDEITTPVQTILASNLSLSNLLSL